MWRGRHDRCEAVFTMTPRDRVMVGGIWGLVGLLLMFGVACWSLSTLSYDVVKAKIDVLSMDGSADPFTGRSFRRLLIAWRVLGSGMILLAALACALRARLQRAAGGLAEAAASFSWGLWQSVRESVRREETVHVWTLVGILSLGMVLRVALVFQPMRYDEAFTFLHFASKPFYVGLAYYEENNHVLHTLLVHVMSSLFGNSPWVIRLPALVAGILVIPAAYLVTRLLYDKHAALLTAGWVAVSSAFIEYSTNARGYSLLCLAFLAILALAHYVRGHRNPFAWTLLIIGSVAGFYTLPTMAYAFGAVITWLILSAMAKDAALPRAILLRQVAVAVLFVGLFVVVCYAPILLANGVGALTKFAPPEPWSVFLVQAQALLLAVWEQWTRDLPGPIRGLSVLGFVVAMMVHRRLARDHVPVVVAAALWCGLLVVAQRVVPLPRHWLSFSPLYVGAASAGVCDLLSRLSPVIARRLSGVVAAAAIVFSGSIGWQVVRSQSVQSVNAAEQFQDAEPIAKFLKRYLQSGDVVIAGVPANAPLEYYFVVHGVPRVYLRSSVGSASRRLLVVAHQPSQQTLRTLLREARVPRDSFGPPEAIRQYPFGTVYELRRNG